MSKKSNTKNVKPNLANAKSNNKNFFSLNNKEIDFKIVSLIGFSISLLLLFFSYKHYGSYFETNDDCRFTMEMKGAATPLPFNSYLFLYVFTVDLYILLYKHFPTIPWYGISLFFLLAGTLFNMFISLYLTAKKRIHFILILLIFVGFFFLILFQNVYWFNFTRPSILGTSSFIILLGVLYLNIDVFKNNKWILIFPILTFVLAHLNRPDGGYLGIAFAISFSILFIFNQNNLLPFVLKFVSPVAVFVAIIFGIAHYFHMKDTKHAEYYSKINLFQSYFDFRTAGSFVPQNLKDTIAYNALNTRYVGDDNVVSMDFLNRLIEGSTAIEGANKKKMKEELTVFNKSLDEENAAAKNLNLGLFILLTIWFIAAVKKNYLGFFKYILFQISFVVLIAAIGYFMKLPARIFSPLLVLYTFSNILLSFSIIYFNKKQFYYTLAIPLVFLYASYSTYSKANNAIISNIKQYGQINKMIIDDMNNRFDSTIFIPIPLRAWEMHSATDPIKEFNFKNKNCYVYLSIDICTAPETKDQLSDKFGTYDHSKLFIKISETPNAIFISDDNYNNFLRAYYHYIYNQDYYFEKATNEIPAFYQYTGLNYYRIKKVN